MPIGCRVAHRRAQACGGIGVAVDASNKLEEALACPVPSACSAEQVTDTTAGTPARSVPPERVRSSSWPISVLTTRVLATTLMMVAISGRCATALRPGFRSWPGYVPEVWHFSNRLSALLTWQRYTSVRRWPAPGHYRRSAASVQFNWDVSRDLPLLLGRALRCGARRRSRDTWPRHGNLPEGSCAFRG